MEIIAFIFYAVVFIIFVLISVDISRTVKILQAILKELRAANTVKSAPEPDKPKSKYYGDKTV